LELRITHIASVLPESPQALAAQDIITRINTYWPANANSNRRKESAANTGFTGLSHYLPTQGRKPYIEVNIANFVRTKLTYEKADHVETAVLAACVAVGKLMSDDAQVPGLDQHARAGILKAAYKDIAEKVAVALAPPV